MHRIIAMIILFVMPLFATQVLPATSKLVPCEFLFQLSRSHEIYYRQLDKIFLSEGKLRERKPIFTMLLCPAFDLEEAISVYQTVDGQYIAERLISNERIWYSMQEQVEKRYSKGGVLSWRDIPIDAEFTFSVKFHVHRKGISTKLASAVGNLFHLALEQRGVPLNTGKQEKEYLDGSVEFFWLPDEACGLAVPGMEPGAGEAIVEIGYLLQKYVTGVVSEETISNLAFKAISRLNNFGGTEPGH